MSVVTITGVSGYICGRLLQLLAQDDRVARIVGGGLLGFPEFVVEVPYSDAPADRFCIVAEARKFRDCRPLGGEYEHGR